MTSKEGKQIGLALGAFLAAWTAANYELIAEDTGKKIEKKEFYNDLKQSVDTNTAVSTLNAQQISDYGLHYKLTDAVTDNTNAQFDRILKDSTITNKEMAFTQVANNATTLPSKSHPRPLRCPG